MMQIKCPISTVALGMVASASVLILVAGSKGLRFSMPNARILIHQPRGGCSGSSVEVNIQVTELNKTMRLIIFIYSKLTGLSAEIVEEKIDRDEFMTPLSAKVFGIIDEII